MGEQSNKFREIGNVVGAKQYLIFLEGVPSARINSLLVNDKREIALVTGFDESRVSALKLDRGAVAAGDQFFFDEQGLTIPQANRLLGRVVNPLGQALDEKENPPSSPHKLPFDVVAGGISTREEINEQFITGIALVDLLLPIGKGQRELVVGPPRSGKTTFVKDIIINQKDSGIICIYTAMGKPASFLRRFSANLYSTEAYKHTIIIATHADDPAPLVAMSPVFAFAIAERLRSNGKDVLVVLDDLATHAKYLREIALLSGRVPGRESYPGDIFYQHAHIMERAGRFRETVGGGSITLLPLLETEPDSMTNLIPTNAMASTDGHLFFSAPLRAQGYFPSVSIEQSVTRVGKQTQFRAQKELADRILALFADADVRSTYSRFGEELSSDTKRILIHASVARELLRQEEGERIPPFAAAAMAALTFTSVFKERTEAFAKRYRLNILNSFINEKKLSQIRTVIENGESLQALLAELEKSRYIIETACRGKKQSGASLER